MIDLHCHILPGVDDGAESLEDAVAMCRLAAADGCVALVATPHLRRDEWTELPRAEYSEILADLQRAVGAKPRLFLGGEIRVDSELPGALRAAGATAPAPLAGSRYLLLEFEPGGFGPEPLALVEELRGEGWTPIVAHPELTPFLAEEPGLLADLVEAGALAQVTAMSVTGDFGKRPRQLALEWIGEGIAHFLASDSHSPSWRPPGLTRAHEEVARRWGIAVAQRVTLANPLAVVERRPIETRESRAVGS